MDAWRYLNKVNVLLGLKQTRHVYDIQLEITLLLKAKERLKNARTLVKDKTSQICSNPEVFHEAEI